MAQKEEEELQRYKEANRPGPIHLNPERLGNVLIHTRAQTYKHILTHKHICADTCMHLTTNTQTHTRTHTHGHAHAHTHTYRM